MANPVAAHTFDGVRIYLSERDGAAPGAGTWSNPQKIFDGLSSGGPLSSAFATTFSAGALTEDLSEPRGILIKNGNRGTDVLAYLGDGLPATPKLFSVGFDVSSVDYWDMSQGAWTSAAGNQYIAGVDSSVFPNRVYVIESADDGDTWAEVDSANAPNTTGIGAMQRIDDTVFFFTDDGSGDYAIQSFIFGTGWQAPVASLSAPSINNFGVNPNSWSNGLFKFSNGDFAVIYYNGNTVYRLFNGSWQPEVTFPAIRYANSVMDPGLELIHVWTYEFFGGRDAPVHYSTVAHDGTITPDIFVIPAPAGGSEDGVGKCSIQNSMLFCPRDDDADFDNAVWVALLSDGQFQKELLPIPSGESDQINSASLNAGGSGYVAFEVVTANGGVNSCQLQITSVDGGGAVLTFSIVTEISGGGYAVASGVSTTGGSGTGFTINILSVGGKTPSCAYMMFPNGYSLIVPPPAIGITCPINSGTATVGELFTSSAPVVVGDTPPDTFALLSGPDWMSIDPATGIVSGTPDVADDFTYVIQVTDSLGNVASTSPGCDLSVSPAPTPGRGISRGMSILTAKQWSEIREKGLLGMPTDIYLDHENPNAGFHLWPIPSLAHQIEFHYWATLQRFASLDEDMDLPEGYGDAVMFNLALALCAVYNRPVPGAVLALAKNGKQVIQDVNSQILSGSYHSSRTLSGPNEGEIKPAALGTLEPTLLPGATEK